MFFGNGKTQFGCKVHEEANMEILWFIRLVQFPDGLFEKIEHGLVLHGMTQDMKEYFAEEQRNRPFVWISDERSGNVIQLCGTHGMTVGGELENGQGIVLACGVFLPQAIHHIINASALSRICVQHVRFV